MKTIETVETLIFICTVITTVSAAINVLVTAVHKLTDPERIQNSRLDSIETHIKTIQQRMSNDDRRLTLLKNITDELSATVSVLETYVKNNDTRMEVIISGEKVTQKSILALISHELHGEDNTALIAARDEITEYLLQK